MKDVLDPVAGRFGLTLWRTGESAVAVEAASSELTVDDRGRIRLSVLVAAVDVAAGVSTGLAAVGDWTLTADIDLHRADVPAVDSIRVSGAVSKHGRRLSLAQITASHAADPEARFAVGSANHVTITPPSEPVYRQLEIGEGVRFRAAEPSDSSLAKSFGLRHITRADGRAAVQIHRTAATSNFYDLLHGAMTAVMVEELVAAELTVVEDLNMRFMRSIREGPGEAIIVERMVNGSRAVLTIEVTDCATGEIATRVVVAGPIRDREDAQ